MNFSTVLLGLSILTVVVSFFRDLAVADRTNTRRWRITLFLGMALLIANVSIEIGRRVSDRARDDVAKQRETDERALLLQLRRDVQSLSGAAAEAFEKLASANKLTPSATVSTLSEDARRVQIQLKALTDAVARDDLDRETMVHLRRSVQESKDAIRALATSVHELVTARTGAAESRLPFSHNSESTQRSQESSIAASGTELPPTISRSDDSTRSSTDSRSPSSVAPVTRDSSLPPAESQSLSALRGARPLGTAANLRASPVNLAALYELMGSQHLESVRFVAGQWAYYIERVSPRKLYIAGVNRLPYYSRLAADAQLKNVFAAKTEKKDADLIVISCGETFGDEDCDFYSLLYERALSGTAIGIIEVELYGLILESAIKALDPRSQSRFRSPLRGGSRPNVTTSKEAPFQIVYRHGGKIVDDRTGAGVAARAVAYASDASRVGGGLLDDLCPRFSEPIQSVRSDPAMGNFVFEFDARYVTYIAQYCANGYVPEYKRNNPNDPHSQGTPVAGNPISLTPRR